MYNRKAPAKKHLWISFVCLQTLWKLPNRHLCSVQEHFLAVWGPRSSVGVRECGARCLLCVRLRGEGWRWCCCFWHVQWRNGWNQTSSVCKEQRPEQKQHSDCGVLPGPQSHCELDFLGNERKSFELWHCSCKKAKKCFSYKVCVFYRQGNLGDLTTLTCLDKFLKLW